jgi:hypothetical protein
LTDITKRRSSKIPTLLANPCSFCIAYDIVLHFVVSDFAAWPVLLLTDYIPFLTSLNVLFLVDVGVDPLCVRLLSPDPFSIILLEKK